MDQSSSLWVTWLQWSISWAKSYRPTASKTVCIGQLSMSSWRPTIITPSRHSSLLQTLRAVSPQASSSSLQRGSSLARKRLTSRRKVSAVSRCRKWCSLPEKYLRYTSVRVCWSESKLKLRMMVRQISTYCQRCVSPASLPIQCGQMAKKASASQRVSKACSDCASRNLSARLKPDSRQVSSRKRARPASLCYIEVSLPTSSSNCRAVFLPQSSSHPTARLAISRSIAFQCLPTASGSRLARASSRSCMEPRESSWCALQMAAYISYYLSDNQHCDCLGASRLISSAVSSSCPSPQPPLRATSQKCWKMTGSSLQGSCLRSQGASSGMMLVRSCGSPWQLTLPLRKLEEARYFQTALAKALASTALQPRKYSCRSLKREAGREWRPSLIISRMRCCCSSKVSCWRLARMSASTCFLRISTLRADLLLCNNCIISQAAGSEPGRWRLFGWLQQMMEAGEKAEAKQDTLNITLKGSGEQPPDFLRFTPAIERKLSKRREAQEERNVVLDLFKELFAKFNDGYSKATAQSRPSRAPRPKNRQKPRREAPPREPKDKPRRDSSEEVRAFSERKEEIWENYAQLMDYQILAEEAPAVPVQPVVHVQAVAAEGMEAEQ